MKFSEELWVAATNIVEAIHQHPFNQELADGGLGKEKFQFYLKQDSLYLVDFARALAITATKSNDIEDMNSFLQFYQGALIAERQLHQYYFNLYGITVDIPQAPSCFAYTNFLLTSATLMEQAETVAALLPCFWIYREDGKHIYTRSVSNNPFQRWIDTYAGNEFDDVVGRAIPILDRIAENRSHEQRKKMKEMFLASCLLEWMFLESTYKLEQWKP